MVALRIVLGGRVGVQGDDGRMAEVGPGRLAPVALAYLVFERHRPVRRDELAEVLWGDDLPSSWDQMVRGLVADLRRLLRDLGVDGNDVLTTMPGCYQVRLPDESVVDNRGRPPGGGGRRGGAGLW